MCNNIHFVQTKENEMHVSALNSEISSLKMEMERMKSLAESERKESQGKVVFWQNINIIIL